MVTPFVFAFAIFFGTIKCDLWKRVNYPRAVEMEYTETVVRSNLVSCVAFCSRREDTLVVSYKAKDCFCFFRNSALVGAVNVSFVFLKYYDYANCFDSGYGIIYPHLEFCLKYYSSKVNWSTANQTCTGDGASLMTLDTDAKCNIATFLPTIDFATRIYVGAKKYGAQFLWNTGGEIQNCWSEGEPSKQSDQRCVALFTSGPIYMHDVQCKDYPFLCQKSAVVII